MRLKLTALACLGIGAALIGFVSDTGSSMVLKSGWVAALGACLLIAAARVSQRTLQAQRESFR